MVERFDLERFEWNAPDRLEVSGRFHGLEQPPAEPVLIVNGGGTPHRLQAAADSAAADGDRWRAEFVWDGVPVGVESAALELSPDVVIELPPPGTGSAQAVNARPAEPSGDVALQARLLAADQESQELRAALERVQAELDRARTDLETERAGRAADAERFRAGLAQVEAAAEQAAARDAEALREQAASADELRQRLSAIEGAGAEAGELRADAERLLERLTRLAESLNPGN